MSPFVRAYARNRGAVFGSVVLVVVLVVALSGWVAIPRQSMGHDRGAV